MAVRVKILWLLFGPALRELWAMIEDRRRFRAWKRDFESGRVNAMLFGVCHACGKPRENRRTMDADGTPRLDMVCPNGHPQDIT
jgi:hypothetical protein